MCGDGASFLSLEFGLEEVLDPPITTLPLVPSSALSTLRGNIRFTMTFPDPPFPLAQSIEFKIGGIFGVEGSVDEDDICCESGDIFTKVHDPNETLVGRPCGCCGYSFT